jgi:hypothetical protein
MLNYLKKTMFFNLAFFCQVTFAQTFQGYTVQNITGSSIITCAKPSIHLRAFGSLSNTALTCTWTNGSNIVIGKNVFLSSPGTYSIIAFLSGTISLPTQTIAISINTLQPLSTISPTSQNISCSLASISNITATAISPSLNATHHFVSPLGGTLSLSASNAIYSPGAPGTYTYYLQNNASGCKSSSLFTLNSTAGLPTFSVLSQQNFSLGCSSRSVDLVSISNLNSNPPGNPLSLFINGVSTPTSQSSFSVNAPNIYTITLKDNVSLCETKMPFSISQNTTAPGVFALILTQTLSCLVPAIGIEGFSSVPDADINWNINSVIWPGPTPGPLSSVYLSYFVQGLSSLGSSTLYVDDPNNACRTTSIIPFYQDYDGPILNSNAASPSALCPGTPSVTIFATLAGNTNNCIFSWTYPANANVSGVYSQSLSTNLPGNYSLTATNTITSCKMGKLFSLFNCVSFVDNTSESVFNIYPNPANDILHIEKKQTAFDVEKLTIYDTFGQTFHLIERPTSVRDIDVRFLTPGVYYIKLKNNSIEEVVKFIKE